MKLLKRLRNLIQVKRQTLEEEIEELEEKEKRLAEIEILEEKKYKIKEKIKIRSKKINKLRD